MKQSKTFLGVLLIGFGLFFVLQQYAIPFLSRFDTWPTILIVLGAAFLAQGYLNKQHESILPGGILLGLGLHFHALDQSGGWIDHWGMYTLIVGFSFLLRAHKTNQGIMAGLILIIISLIGISSITLPRWFGWIDYLFSQIEQFWPFLLIGIGAFLLFKK